MEGEDRHDDQVPAEGSEERIRLAASALHRRERQAFGGRLQWEAAFFGWLAAIGLAALLVAIVVGAGLAVGITELKGSAAEKTKTLTLGGGVVIVVIVALAYFSGGYVGGRMARFDGWRQGFGVWAIGLAVTAALALAGAIGGSQYNVLSALDLPRIPVDEGDLTTGGAIALAAAAVGTLLAALAGGVAGERFHRAVDAAGIAIGPPLREAEAERRADEGPAGQATERRVKGEGTLA